MQRVFAFLVVSLALYFPVRAEVREVAAATSIPAAATARTVIVAADGTAQFRTLGEAIRSLGDKAAERPIIRVRPGIYREKLVIPPEVRGVTIVGEDQVSTILTWADYADKPTADNAKIGTFGSATITVQADDFSLVNITVQNSYGAGSQAVALRVNGDRFVARRCRIRGWQDTLLVEKGRHYFEDCLITGHVDFVFGGATAFFDRCRLHVLASGFIAAPSTLKESEDGLVFHRCRISAEEGVKAYLGRPWRDYGNATFVRCNLPGAIHPEGWHNWDAPQREATARFLEGANTGPGAKRERRVAWSRELIPEEVDVITPEAVLSGADGWNPATVPAVHRAGTQISDALSVQRVEELPETQRSAWTAYLGKSQSALQQDKSVLSAEVQDSGLANPARPPAAKRDILDLKRADEWYRSDEAAAIVAAVLSYQTPSGGWSKGASYAHGPRQRGMHWSPQASETLWHYVGTFDNGSTTKELRFLAKVHAGTGAAEVRAAWRRGFEYILAAQYPNGGWPQVYPLEGGYHDAITFNDNAMISTLLFLRDVSDGVFGFVNESDRQRASDASRRGVECIIKSQVTQNGRLTVWCAQHDPITLAPVAARLKEPASLSGAESAAVVEFLLKFESPSKEVETAIENARTWFERSKQSGLREVVREGRDFWQQDPQSNDPVWARFYDLVTNQPIFGGAQDGIIYDDFESMWRNNRFGYDFYSAKPRRLLKR